MDEDGYPTDKTLDTVKNWHYTKGFKSLLEYICEVWIYPNYCDKEDYKNLMNRDKIMYSISTGGWSGHEELITALEDNSMFWIMCWEESKRGGHYKFSVDKE